MGIALLLAIGTHSLAETLPMDIGQALFHSRHFIVAEAIEANLDKDPTIPDWDYKIRATETLSGRPLQTNSAVKAYRILLRGTLIDFRPGTTQIFCVKEIEQDGTTLLGIYAGFSLDQKDNILMALASEQPQHQ